jgi:RNA polymerase sigma-70 factor (ECF subfamily)
MLENKFLLTKQGFEVLINENNGIIWKICRMYQQDEDNQKDLYQEIVLQIWKTLPRFRGESKISTWIYRVALNMAISGFRKSKRQPYQDKIDERVIKIADEHDDEKQELIKQMYRAIGKLSAVEKAMILLHLDEKPYNEIAEIMGITQNNLRVKMNRTREKLRNLMNLHGNG